MTQVVLKEEMDERTYQHAIAMQERLGYEQRIASLLDDYALLLHTTHRDQEVLQVETRTKA